MNTAEASSTHPNTFSGWRRSTLAALLRFREVNIIFAFLLLCLFFWWQRPDVFFEPANLAIIMRFMATFGFLAIGEVLVIITGGIDLSVGSMTALTGVLAAMLMTQELGFLPPLGIAPAIVAALAFAALIGLWHGYCVTKLHIPPFFITLGTWLIARGMAAFITRGYPIVFPSDSPFLALGQRTVFQIPIMFVILVIVALIAIFVLNATTLGRHIYAVGDNLEAARVAGVHVDRVRLFCYASSGVMAGLAGILLASRLGQGSPTVGSAYELWAIAATVLGGTSLFGGEGTIVGAVLGAAIMGVLINGIVLVNLSPYLQDVMLGAVLIFAITYDTWRRHRRR